jgi:large repetitive protein
MVRKLITHLVLVLGLLSFTGLKAQQVKFALSPSTVTGNVGDVVSMDVIVTNFTNIVSLQMALDWDPALFDTIKPMVQNVNMPNPSGFDFNVDPALNTMRYLWIPGGSVGTVPNGQAIFRIRFKIKAASTNYWVRFVANSSDLELIQTVAGANVPVIPALINVGNPPGTTPVTVKSSSHTVPANSSICVGVTADNFTGIESAKWDMQWNQAVLRYESLTKLNTTLGINNTHFTTTQAVSNGRLSFAWTTTPAKTVPTGDTLYKVCFTAIGAASTSTSVQTLTAGAEVLKNSSGSSTSIGIVPQNGSVSIAGVAPPPTGNLTISGSVENANVGDTACVRIYAKNFKEIAFMTWSMRFDSTKLSFVKARTRSAQIGTDTLIIPNPALAPNYTSLPNNLFTYRQASPVLTGSLRFFGDLSANADGVTLLADSTLIYDVCFKVLGGVGTTAFVNFVGDPLKIQVLDKNFPGSPAITPTFLGGSVVIGASTPAIVATGNVTNVNCNGGTTGGVVLTVSGGTGAYTYSWTGPSGFTATTKDIATRGVGAYVVTISSGAATPSVQNFTITEPSAALTTTKVVTNVNCGQTTGSVVLTPAGGTAPYTYTWSSSETTKDITSKGAGTYTVTITDAKTCTKIEISDITNTASTLASSKVITNVNCFAGATGSIVLTATGGATPYIYTWSSGETTKDVTGKVAGTYTVTITDANTCKKTETGDITQPSAALGSSKVITNVNCFSQATGSVVLTVTGGTAPYTYLWSSGETTKDLSNKAAGTYNVTITDAKSCSKTETADITQPTAAVSATNAVTNIKCHGGNDGAIALTVSGGTPNYTYSWAGPSGFTAATKDIATLLIGGYSVTITDSKNCALTLGPIQVTEPAVIAITPSVTNSSCAGNTGAISVNVTGGTAPLTYKWTGPNGYAALTANISALAAGSYTLEVTDNNGCKKSSVSAVAVINSNFTVVPNPTNINCNAGTDGAISLTVAGGSGVFTYVWSGPSFSAATKDVTGLKAGTYNVTVTETSTSCTVSPVAIILSEPTAIVIGTPQVVDVKCKGDGSGEITINPTGGIAPYTYSWTGPNGFTAINTRAIGTLKAGIYNVTVTDSKNCTKTTTIEVKEPTGTALAIGSPSITSVSCAGEKTGAVVISVTGGTPQYTYAWSGPIGFTNTQQNLSTIGAGTYKVTVTDANGCKAISSDALVREPNPLAATGTVTNAVAACNGKIDLIASGGALPFTYAWTGKDVIAANKDQANLCPSETYNVTVTDGNGCKLTRSFTITGTIAPPISLTDSSIVSQAGCPGQNNGAINISFAGGKSPFSFEWINSNNSVIGRAQNISRLGAGKYRVKVLDAVGQIYVSAEFEIKESASTIAIATGTLKAQSCGATDGELRIDVLGGVIPYKYTWNTGATSKDLLNIVEGKYSVTVMDNNNCLSEKKDIMVERTLCPLTVVPVVKAANCFGEKAAVTVNIQNGEPGYVLRWSQNDSVRINNTPRKDGTYDISNLAAGTYVFTVTDAKGQVSTTSVTITQPEEIKITKTVAADSGNCSGNIILSVTGGMPQYSYVWNDGVRSRDRFNLCAGQILSVTVTDTKNCFVATKNDTIRSGVRALVLGTTPNITNAACPNDSTGRIDITVEGGVKPYKYVWSHNSTLEDPINLKSGNYSVTVLDSGNPVQMVFGTYTIGAISTLKITNVTTTTSAATVTIEGGEGPYSIAWCNGTTQNSSNLSVSQINLAGGVCGVTVTDSKGCKVSRAFDISAACAVVTANPLSCATSKGPASIQTITDQSLTPPHLIRWDNGETGTTATSIAAGARTVTVIGNNGKTCIANFVMRAPTELKVSRVDVKDVDCSLEAIVTGGVAPYKYEWSTLKKDTSVKVINLDNGKNYFVIVKDANNCGTDPGVGTAQCSSFCLQGGSILTPNDDAKNDKFDIQKCDYKNVQLLVYNRWGQLVYQSEDYTDQWEGKTQDGKSGKDLPEGVYMYVLKGVQPSGKELTNKGTVTILRQ